MSQPSHTAASHINALARKHYPRPPKAFHGTQEEFVALMEGETTIPTKAIPISDAAATVRE